MGFCLIGPGEQRVAADAQQRAYLALAGRENFIADHCRGHFAARPVGGEHHRLADVRRDPAAHTVFQPAALRPAGLREARPGWREYARVGHAFAGAAVPPADGIQCLHQMLQQIRVRAHLRAGAGDGGAARPGCEHARSLDDLAGINAGGGRHARRCEALECRAQRVETAEMLCAELMIVALFRKDHMQHRRHHGGVVSRPYL